MNCNGHTSLLSNNILVSAKRDKRKTLISMENTKTEKRTQNMPNTEGEMHCSIQCETSTATPQQQKDV
jgi:hypothetical protein